MKKKTLMELLIVVQCLSHSITLAWVRLQKTIMEAKMYSRVKKQA